MQVADARLDVNALIVRHKNINERVQRNQHESGMGSDEPE